MKLLTEELKKVIPPLRSTENQHDPVVRAKFFSPDSSWTWYVIEGGPVDDDFHFFGLVDGHVRELGYFSLAELEAVRGPLGLRIERDLWWTPRALSVVVLVADA